MAAILPSLLALSFFAGCSGPTTGDRPPGPPEQQEIVPSRLVRVARLSHTQWENAVRDLLGLAEPTGLSSAFVKDSTRGEFDNEDEGLGVDQVLFQQYQDAAWLIADRVVSDPAVRAHVVGRELGPEAPEDFIRGFGRKVHREPLTDEQVDQYIRAWDVGVSQGSGEDPADDGLRQLVASMFQSPFFLYRVEAEGEVQKGQLVVTVEGEERRYPVVYVNPHDLAARLSFSLWNTIPDTELDRVADDGTLRDEEVLRAQVDRMLGDPRAEAMIEDLHEQLLLVDLYVNIAPDTVLFPDYDLAAVPAMQDEVRAFVGEVVRTGGGVRELLLSRRTFVNPLLAEIYGLPPVPDTGKLEPVDLPQDERAGLLTLSGFLAANSDPAVNNPIRRGFFVNTSILCQNLPTPPAFVEPIPPAEEGMTTRDRINRATGPGTCGEGCHANFINPAGFAFEHYGPLGEFRTEERGLPVDASAQYTFEDLGPQTYDGAIEFSQILAESSQVHDCYSRHLFEYLYGRYPDWRYGDLELVDATGATSLEQGTPIRELVKELVIAPAFRTIPPDLPSEGGDHTTTTTTTTTSTGTSSGGSGSGSTPSTPTAP